MANVNISRKSGFIRRHGVMRRETMWFGGTIVLTTMAAGNNPVLVTTLSAAALALRPFTVVRARGMLYILSDQVTATEQQTAIYGEAVVSDQAVAIGITAVPTPVNDSDSDLWFVYQPLFNAVVHGGTNGGLHNVGTRYDMDSHNSERPQRKRCR